MNRNWTLNANPWNVEVSVWVFCVLPETPSSQKQPGSPTSIGALSGT